MFSLAHTLFSCILHWIGLAHITGNLIARLFCCIFISHLGWNKEKLSQWAWGVKLGLYHYLIYSLLQAEHHISFLRFQFPHNKKRTINLNLIIIIPTAAINRTVNRDQVRWAPQMNGIRIQEQCIQAFCLFVDKLI